MPSSPTHQLPPPLSDAAAQQGASPANRKVGFGASSPQAGKHQAPPSKAPPPAAAAASCADAGTHFNQLFSPSGPARQDSWTIEAQRSDRAPMAEAGSSGAAAVADSSPAASSLLGSYTPASAGFLESARKVDDLRGRLESLEAALREMESKAVAQLDRSLQDKVLATAGELLLLLSCTWGQQLGARQGVAQQCALEASGLFCSAAGAGRGLACLARWRRGPSPFCCRCPLQPRLCRSGSWRTRSWTASCSSKSCRQAGSKRRGTNGAAKSAVLVE